MLLICGCASLDATPDIARASTPVKERALPASVDSFNPWMQAWDEPSNHWDGHIALSSDTAVRVALQNNREIRRAVERIVEARAEYVQAHLLPNPVINLAIGFPTDGMGGQPLAAAFVQQLAWLWRRPVAIDRADAELQAQVLDVSNQALQLVADVRTAHANVYYAQHALLLQIENTELLRQSEQLLQQRFDVGEASRLDVNRVTLDLEAAEVDLRDREANLRQAKRHLLALLGRSSDSTAWSVDERDFEGTAPGEVLAGIYDETQLIERAEALRLDVAAADARVQSQAEQVVYEQRGVIPDISVGAAYQQNFSDRPGVFPSVGITPKIFDDNSAQIAKAKSQWRQTMIQADNVRQTAITQTRQAWIDVQTQRDVVQQYEQKIVQLAANNMDLARLAFEAGDTDLTVLLEAQRQFNVARLAGIERRNALTSAMFELERAVGGSLHVPTTPDVAAASLDSDHALHHQHEVAP